MDAITQYLLPTHCRINKGNSLKFLMRFTIHICIYYEYAEKLGLFYTWQIYGSQSIVLSLLPSVNSGVFYVGNNSQLRSQYFHILSNYSLGLLNLWYFVLGSTYPPVADQGSHLLMMDWLPWCGGGGVFDFINLRRTWVFC